MWDGQYPTPAQNALAAVPYMDISWRQYITRGVIIKRNFLPILDVFLMVLLKSSFLSAADVQAYSEAVMQMWRYFQIHDWERTWNSPQVRTENPHVLFASAKTETSHRCWTLTF